MYQYGLQLVRARRYYEAIRVFDEFLRYYARSSLADNALYWTGESYYAMKQYSVALSYFQRIPYEYPRGNKVPDSLLKTALSYFSMRQYSRGCQALNDLMYRYPNSESARKGYRWLNRCGGGGGCYPSPTPYGCPDYNRGTPAPYYYDSTFPKNY
jgi:tol-pal system protein YbgF